MNPKIWKFMWTSTSVAIGTQKKPTIGTQLNNPHMVYIIMYAGCAVLWKLQMQTEIALSSTESEYIGLSYML
jgi:hypothetical protein